MQSYLYAEIWCTTFSIIVVFLFAVYILLTKMGVRMYPQFLQNSIMANVCFQPAVCKGEEVVDKNKTIDRHCLNK